MQTYGLGEWLENTFGTTGDGLFFDDNLTEEIELVARDSEYKYEETYREMATVDESFRTVVEKGANASDSRRKVLKAEAKRLKTEYEHLEQRLHEYGVRHTAVVVIQAIRETGDGIPDPSDAELAIRAGYANSVLHEDYFETYMRVIKEVLDSDELLSGLPEPDSVLDPSWRPVPDPDLNPGPDISIADDSSGWDSDEIDLDFDEQLKPDTEER